jgi:hypothetical protein
MVLALIFGLLYGLLQRGKSESRKLFIISMIFGGILAFTLPLVSSIAFNSIPSTPDVYIPSAMMFLFGTYLFEPGSFLDLTHGGSVTVPGILLSTSIATFVIGIQFLIGAKIGDYVEDHI